MNTSSKHLRNVRKHNTQTFSNLVKDSATLRKGRNSQKLQHIPTFTYNTTLKPDQNTTNTTNSNLSFQSQPLHKDKPYLQTNTQKIKTIDQKLELHQSELQKNQKIIEQLTKLLLTLKDQFVVEKQKLQSELNRNKILREEVERCNKIIRNKNMRIQELVKKNQFFQKEIVHLEDIKSKYDKICNDNVNLTSQLTKLQQKLKEKKPHEKQKNNSKCQQRQRQRQRQKQRQKLLQYLQSTKTKLQNDQKQQNIEINQLHKQIKILSNQNQTYRFKSDKNNQVSVRLSGEIKELKDKLRVFEELLLESKNNQKKEKDNGMLIAAQLRKVKQQFTKKQILIQNLKKQIEELRQKYTQQSLTIQKSQSNQNTNHKKLSTLTDQLTQLKSQLQFTTTKLTTLTQHKKTLQSQSQTLHHLYLSMLPQIQCPLGHELEQPVTIIPCGHNYCFGCKKGYTKECMMCSKELKIEAVYRNQLMDDIVKIVSAVRIFLEVVK